jgi:hypothetical protein
MSINNRDLPVFNPPILPSGNLSEVYKKHILKSEELIAIRIRWNSIYRKLFLTYLALTALGTSILASYILFSFHAYFMRTRQGDLDVWTTALGESVADALEENDLRRVELLVQRYGSPDSVTLRILGPDGRLLFTSAPQLDQQITNWFSVPGVREALQNQPMQGVAKGVSVK